MHSVLSNMKNNVVEIFYILLEAEKGYFMSLVPIIL